MQWKIIAKTNATVTEGAGCTVCNLERLAIASVSPDVALNVRNELAGNSVPPTSPRSIL